jgi:hypothetical protein
MTDNKTNNTQTNNTQTNNTQTFPTGSVYMTHGVNTKAAADPGYSAFAQEFLHHL